MRQYGRVHLKGALQLLINRYGSIRFAHVHERVSTKSFVVLIIGNPKSFHLGAQGTFNPTLTSTQTRGWHGIHKDDGFTGCVHG